MGVADLSLKNQEGMKKIKIESREKEKKREREKGRKRKEKERRKKHSKIFKLLGAHP